MKEPHCNAPLVNINVITAIEVVEMNDLLFDTVAQINREIIEEQKQKKSKKN